MSDDAASRLAVLERAAAGVSSNADLRSCAPAVLRVCDALRAAAVLGAALWRAPAGYYDLPLRERGMLLDCPMERLCKTLIFRNLAGRTRDPGCPLGIQTHVAVIIQYVSKLDIGKLERFVAARGGGPTTRLVLAEDGSVVTGFAHNAVCPLGMLAPMPIVLSKAIATLPSPPCVWLGGGEPDLKLRMFVPQLLRLHGTVVADCTVPRVAGGDDDAADGE